MDRRSRRAGAGHITRDCGHIEEIGEGTRWKSRSGGLDSRRERVTIIRRPARGRPRHINTWIAARSGNTDSRHDLRLTAPAPLEGVRVYVGC